MDKVMPFPTKIYQGMLWYKVKQDKVPHIAIL